MGQGIDVRGAVQAHNELKAFELNKLTVAGKRLPIKPGRPCLVRPGKAHAALSLGFTHTIAAKGFLFFFPFYPPKLI